MAPRIWGWPLYITLARELEEWAVGVTLRNLMDMVKLQPFLLLHTCRTYYKEKHAIHKLSLVDIPRLGKILHFIFGI